MIGNAVPVEFAKCLASMIYKDISEYLKLHQLTENSLTQSKQETSVFIVSKKTEADLVKI